MDLEAREVREPNERRKIIDENVADVVAGRFAAWHRNRLDPCWGESGSVFLVERFAENTIGKALEGNWTIFNVRK